MATKTEHAQTRKANIQKLIAVSVILVSLVCMVINPSLVWAGIFFAGMVWFVVIRILYD